MWNVHIRNAFSCKIAPVLNIFCLQKIFVDWSIFMFTLIRRSCPGASCVFLKDNTYVPEHWRGKDYFKTCTFQSNIKVLPSSLYAQRQSTIIFSPLVIIVIIMSILFNSSCHKYVTVTSSTTRWKNVTKERHIISLQLYPIVWRNTMAFPYPLNSYFHFHHTITQSI